jgi:signal transduction histidine kinase
MIDFSYTQDEEAFRASLRRFLAKEVAPLCAEAEEQARFPRRLFARFGEMGYLGIPYPVEVGGAGLGYQSFCLYAEELGRVNSGIAGSLLAQSSIGSLPIHLMGTDAQKERHLAPALRGRVTDDNRKQDYYSMILRESDRLGRLVENVLDFARMEDGRKEYRLEPIQTAAWVRAAAASFGETLSARDRTIETTVPDTLPAIVGDREALASAVHNLLDNAVKYSPGTRTIWLEAGSTDGRVVIRVRDEGVGISAEDLPRVFDRFFRSAQLADSVRGTGLGLSLVQHVVQAHGGTITCASTPGQGTTFTMTLPAR